MKTKTQEIGTIGNYYGGLFVRKTGDLHTWGIKDWDGSYGWEVIPESLYNEIIKFQEGK